jgi:hypothetical protein
MKFNATQFLLLPHAAVHLQSVFGLEGDGSECSICLTAPKEVLLLPCRHLCVCQSCLVQIDKCPVCRSEFAEHIIIQNIHDPQEGEEGEDSSSDMSEEELVAAVAVAEAMGPERLAQSTDTPRKAEVM